jgi:hypothetical protein
MKTRAVETNFLASGHTEKALEAFLKGPNIIVNGGYAMGMPMRSFSKAVMIGSVALHGIDQRHGSGTEIELESTPACGTKKRRHPGRLDKQLLGAIGVEVAALDAHGIRPRVGDFIHSSFARTNSRQSSVRR